MTHRTRAPVPACALLLLGLLALLVDGCRLGPAPARPPAPSADGFSRAIRADVDKLTADFNSGDVKALATHYADDQVLMTSGQSNVYGAADAMKHRQQQTAYDITLALTETSVIAAASRDVATVRSICTVTVADKTTHKVLQTQAENCVLVYRRQPDGSMKVEWSVTSAMAPAKPGG